MAVALVTGGSGGIGQACARTLSEEQGCDVAIHYNSDEESARALADDLDATGVRSDTYQCDVGDSAAVEEMVGRIREDLGPVTVLVNNAGVGPARSLFETSTDQLDRVLAINLLGTMHCTRAVLPDMLEAERGRIVNVASSAGIHGSRRDPTYGASKGGMIAFSKSLARAYTRDGVLSNVVAPGPTDTEMYRDEWRSNAESNIRIGRLIRPDEVAEAVAFFVATSSVSGKVLEVDGGRDV